MDGGDSPDAVECLDKPDRDVIEEPQLKRLSVKVCNTASYENKNRIVLKVCLFHYTVLKTSQVLLYILVCN